MVVWLGDKRVTTKAQLRAERQFRAYRRHKMEDLWMLPPEHPKRVAQQSDFAAADAIYESEKEALLATLEVLSLEEWEAYCAAIQWEPVGETQEEQIHDYLARG